MRGVLYLTCFLFVFVLLSACQQPTEAPVKETPAQISQALQYPNELFEVSIPCSLCHDGLKDNNGNDVSIFSDWKQSMMSHAAKDTYWQAKVSTEVSKNPHLREVIEDKCATCHMPMARTQAKVSGLPVAIFNGFLDNNNKLYGLAIDGVSCTLCHQIQAENLGNNDSFSGKYIIDTKTKKPERKIFGPFKPVLPQMMRSVGYMPTKGEHVEKSELCAICHTLYTPYLDNKGEVAGMLPEQTPFLEWLNSKYSRYSPSITCQRCHMPEVSGVRISSRPKNPEMLPERSPFGRHLFIGGNAQILKLMGAEKGVNRSKEQLKNAVNLSIISVNMVDGKLKIRVKIENKAGHKFPTGFPSRRAWIHVTIADADGKIIFESGKVNSDGSIVGEDKPYEPHYDVIDNENEVQIYESVMIDINGKVTQTLLRGAEYIKDNRLLPQGFDKENANPDIGVKGKAMEDDNFVGGSDVVTYIIKVSTYKAPFRVRAELLYQPISYHFLLDLENTPTEFANNFIKSFSKIEKTSLVAYDEH